MQAQHIELFKTVIKLFLISVRHFQKHFIKYYSLCGLVVRVLGYRSGGPGSIPGTTQNKKVVGLERGPLSLVSTTVEMRDRKVAVLV
jgi:hypothetical protein